jgi:ElaB/YqjD/DUF883 family membrane-anchored ribosome-binding protein
MNKNIQTVGDNVVALAQNAHTRVAATADAAEETLGKVRQRLADTMEGGRKLYDRVREQAADGASAADVAVHDHPYQAIGVGIGIGIGLGALVGYLLARQCTRHCG